MMAHDGPELDEQISAPAPAWRRARRWALFTSLLSALLIALAVVTGVAGRGLILARTWLGAQSAAPAPDTQQVFRQQLASTFLATLDPALVTRNAEIRAVSLLFPGLVTLDAQLRPVPWAAARWEASPDGVVYTFHLRAGMRFSSGEPLTAGTFASSLNRALDPCTASPVAEFLFLLRNAEAFHAEVCAGPDQRAPAPGQTAPVLQTLLGASIEAPDTTTLRLHLAHPAAYFLAELTYPVAAAVPQSLLARYGAQWSEHLAEEGGVGGSLFKVTQWEKTGVLVLERNQAFWGAKPLLREIIFTTGVAPTLPAALSETPLATYDVGPEEYQRPRPGWRYEKGDTLSMSAFVPNWRLPPFDDARMRQAFALALDKRAIVAQLANVKFAAATNHLVPEGMPGYNPDLRGVDGTQSLAGDTTQALSLATQYAEDHCGGKLSDCPPVTVSVSADYQVEGAAALAMWRAALPGYPLTLEQVSRNTAPGHPVQLIAIGVSPDYPDPQNLLSLTFLPGAPFNSGSVDLPAATRLLEVADAEQDSARRLADYQQAEQLLVAAAAWIPLQQDQQAYAVRAEVKNYHVTALLQPTLASWAQVYVAEKDATDATTSP
jgi:oligopeptide transport system substrate-binding protein